MSTLFNRKDTAVIQFALNNSLEVFLQEYSTTSASAETLQKAYEEINKNKTKANIAVKSGDGKPDEPLAPIIPASDKDYGLNEKGEIETPKSLKFEKGKLVKTTPNPDATIDKEVAKSKKEVKAAVTKKESKPKAASTDGKPSKRDAIKAFLLLEGNSTKTNKEVREAIIAQGYPSCYDSEISAVKTKL